VDKIPMKELKLRLVRINSEKEQKAENTCRQVPRQRGQDLSTHPK
jgi:hypothetical protein